MGLLDDLLTGLGESQRTGRPAQPQASGSAGGMSNIMMALLPIVLSMLANRGTGGAQSRTGQSGGGGGLGDLLGQILGGGGGSGGGLGGLLTELQRAGYGQQADSWVSRGQNLPLPPEALEQVFGRGGLAEIARRAGVSEAEASRGLSDLLPEVVDRVTPEGRVPDMDALTASVDAMTRRVGRG